jgi:hypothetical protein
MRVPEYQQSVSQQGLPDVRQTTHYTADDFMGGTEKAALGYGVELAGNLANDAQKVAVKHYEDQLKQARDARVLDANTKMMTHLQDAMYGPDGALNKTGEAAFLGSDGKTVSDIAYDDMVKQQQAILDTLGDDEQKAMFNAHSMPMLTSMRQSLMGHEAEQHRVYVRSTLEANNAAQVSNIDHNYNDNDGMRKSIDQIKLNSAQLAKTNGQGAEAGAVIAQTHISGALNKVINSALDRNDATSIPTALNIMKNFAPNMNTDDLVAGYAKIANGQKDGVALSTASQANEIAKVQSDSSDGARAWNVMQSTESATGQYPAGTKFYGLRHDGTAKGSGYFGELKRPDGSISTELTIGVNINGKEMEIPSLVPTLSEKQKEWLLTHNNEDKTPDDIVKVATEHAKQRLKAGLSVFHDTPEPVTSEKGAVGAAQVMKDTGPEAAALAGLPWDENKWKYDEAYNLAIGKAYFQKQLQDNHGDLQKAWAAYNGGPGALKTAIANAKDGNWLALMRPETIDYVAKNLTKFNAGEGKPAQWTKEDTVAKAISMLGPNASADLIKKTISDTEHGWTVHNEAIKQNEDSVVSQVMTELHKNGGDINAVPQSLKSQIPGDKIGAVQDFAVKTAKGIPIETDDKLFYELYRDPARLKLTNLLAFRDQLNDSDLRTLQKLQLDDNKDSDITTVRPAKAVLDDYMGEIGINPNPKPDDAEGSAKVGKIYGQFQTKLNNFEESVGRKATPDEIKKQAAELFTQIDIKGRFWGTNKSTLAQMKDTDVIVVPADDREQITQLYKAKNGGVSPSDDYILSTYKAHKGIN